ncbi:enoyl-CoA hydratase 2, peroxisomal-like isoform X1 [Panicum miliaceum]|uniref:Enoyl-CoA hydratase 2, peroxisomal-like isoform X1 n=1 Tax=Panicum miliaceum TaxID=4540 RepID=A0A3L6TE98_PANMI|nr:enoyl-CoA hydratase 2, peroxisomal-like isoform X1 [Panicum miliaceum]
MARAAATPPSALHCPRLRRLFRRRRTMAMAPSASAMAPVVKAIDPAMIVSHKFPEVTFGDVALYSLGVGACSADAGLPLRSTIYLRGAGGFSNSSRPFSYATYGANEVSNATFPDSTPSAALLCSLSGYFDPLHSDPTFAHAAGFSHPILPGLCTLGFAVRAVMRSFCSMEPAAVRSISCRFPHQVYPGETLVTEMWLQGHSRRVYYRTKVKERGRAVLSGYVQLKHIPSSL